MNEVYLLTGGNLGDRQSYLLKAGEAVQKNCGPIVETSSVYETAAWGKEDQDAFLNQVLHIRTHLNAVDLLTEILRTETELGRVRGLKFGPRIIDIDILFFNDDIIELPGLKIPHPQMPYRRFVLEPLCEIAAGKIHPLLHKNIAQMLAECPDLLAVNKIS
jgi:2-amino-4-hydroxy-6-hydroxymethyldihydropteridine diphosphokinase